ESGPRSRGGCSPTPARCEHERCRRRHLLAAYQKLSRRRTCVTEPHASRRPSLAGGGRRPRAASRVDRSAAVRRPVTSKRKRRSHTATVRRMVIAGLALGVATLVVWEFRFLRLTELRDPRAVRLIAVPTPQGTRTLTIGPQNPYWTPIVTASRALVVCVVRAEDAKFFQHDGFDWDQVQDSLETDFDKGAYKRGGSTITMQLARNLFLWRSKSIARKALEVYLTWRLEHTLSKQRILELYLNTAEWGPGIYGIGEASRHYYARPPSA